MSKMQIAAFALGLAAIVAIAIAGAMGAFAGTPPYEPGPGPGPEPVATSPVESFRGRIQQGAGRVAIFQFTLAEEFTFGTLEFDADSWAEHNAALTALIADDAITTNLQNNIVIFGTANGELVTSIISGGWAGSWNVIANADNREGVTNLAGSNSERTLEVLAAGQAYENAANLTGSIYNHNAWELGMIVIVDGQVFRYNVGGVGRVTDWANTPHTENLTEFDLSETTGNSVNINTETGVVSYENGGFLRINQDTTTIQFNIDTQLEDGEFLVFSINSADEAGYIMSAFVGAKMVDEQLYIAFAPRDSRFGLYCPTEWATRGIATRQVANLNDIRLTFSAGYVNATLSSPTMVGDAITGRHLPDAGTRTPTRMFTVWLLENNVAGIAISNILVA